MSLRVIDIISTYQVTKHDYILNTEAEHASNQYNLTTPEALVKPGFARESTGLRLVFWGVITTQLRSQQLPWLHDGR